MRQYHIQYPEQVCKCGCGERFYPNQKHQVYINKEHKAVADKNNKKSMVVRIDKIIECPHCKEKIDLKQLKENNENRSDSTNR